MEITGNNPFTRLNAYVKNIGREKTRVHGTPEEGPKECLTGDQVVLSSEAKQMQEIKNAFNAIPDIREAKVAEIKAQIEDGTYTIDGEKIASKMIKEFILNELL